MVLHHILSHLLNTKNHLGYRGQSPKNDAIATTLGAKFVFLMGFNGTIAPYFVTFTRLNTKNYHFLWDNLPKKMK